ncbi:hypothetical protein ACFX15_032508 [Malus domestica]
MWDLTFTSSEYIVVHSGRLSKIKPLAQLDKATEGARIFGAPMSIEVESVDLKPKRFDEVKENTDTSTNVEDPDKTNCR